MRERREARFGEAVLGWDDKGGARGERDGAFAPREEDEPLDERGAKEPTREREPGEGGDGPLEYAREGLDTPCASEPEEEEGKGRPSPGAFDEPDVEEVGFVGKVVGLLKRVGEVGNEWVGCVEVGVVLDGVDGAEEKHERERYEGCLSGIDTNRHDGGKSRTNAATSGVHAVSLSRDQGFEQ